MINVMIDPKVYVDVHATAPNDNPLSKMFSRGKPRDQMRTLLYAADGRRLIAGKLRRKDVKEADELWCEAIQRAIVIHSAEKICRAARLKISAGKISMLSISKQSKVCDNPNVKRQGDRRVDGTITEKVDLKDRFNMQIMALQKRAMPKTSSYDLSTNSV